MNGTYQLLDYADYINLLGENITVAARSKARTVFARSNTEIVGLNPTGGMDVCGPLFCVLSCVWAAALRRVEPPPRTSTDCIGLGKLRRPKPNKKGCRA
jgi:hypothetical protein